MARQFNQIPPICEQAEYHLFQREKVEVQLPELSHKIGECLVWARFGEQAFLPLLLPACGRGPVHGCCGCRYRGDDLVSSGLRDHLREVHQRDPPLLPGLPEGKSSPARPGQVLTLPEPEPVPPAAPGLPVDEGQDPERGGLPPAGEAQGAAGAGPASGMHAAPAGHR